MDAPLHRVCNTNTRQMRSNFEKCSFNAIETRFKSFTIHIDVLFEIIQPFKHKQTKKSFRKVAKKIFILIRL